MRKLHLSAGLLGLAVLTTGCASHPRYYYNPPPPPPPAYGEVPPLVGLARQEGFRFGQQDGSRDAYYNRGYRPTGDRTYRETPGYDPRLGPFPPYRDEFRSAYLNGYERGYRRPQ